MSRIGVFGGMGPSATVDFMEKLVRLTPATRDQEHLPMIVASLPHIADRSASILCQGLDPLPALLAGIDLFNHIGVGVVAITCNSAHHWYSQMAARSRAPIIHIAQACVAAVPLSPAPRVAVLGTRGALQSGFYQEALHRQGIAFVVPVTEMCQLHVDECIRLVKAGSLQDGTASFDQALATLPVTGVSAVILGCTELPIAARGARATPLCLIDSTLELAKATVAFAIAKGWNKPVWVS